MLQSISRYARRALGLLFLANLMNFYDRQIVSALAEAIKAECNYSACHCEEQSDKAIPDLRWRGSLLRRVYTERSECARNDIIRVMR